MNGLEPILASFRPDDGLPQGVRRERILIGAFGETRSDKRDEPAALAYGGDAGWVRLGGDPVTAEGTALVVAVPRGAERRSVRRGVCVGF
jgi:hypothetical protein